MALVKDVCGVVKTEINENLIYVNRFSFIKVRFLFMQLFERVRTVASLLAGNQTALANKLDLSQATFNGYLKENRQNNLWPLLPKILEIFPNLNRGWLYFGEGEMLDGTQKDQPSAETLRAELEQVKQELDEERRLNRQLTTRLLIDGVGEKGVLSGIGKVGDGQG